MADACIWNAEDSCHIKHEGVSKKPKFVISAKGTLATERVAEISMLLSSAICCA